MNKSILEVAESHFRPTSNNDKARRLAEVRATLRVRERALRHVQKQIRLEQRVAARGGVQAGGKGDWKTENDRI